MYIDGRVGVGCGEIKAWKEALSPCLRLEILRSVGSHCSYSVPHQTVARFERICIADEVTGSVHGSQWSISESSSQSASATEPLFVRAPFHRICCGLNAQQPSLPTPPLFCSQRIYNSNRLSWRRGWQLVDVRHLYTHLLVRLGQPRFFLEYAVNICFNY